MAAAESRVLFLTVTDGPFFPGTVATVNSVREYHPAADICVVHNHLDKRPLTPAQRDVFVASNVRLVEASKLFADGRKLAAWELKSYGAADLTGGYDVLVGIDSDCVLCGPIHDLLAAARESDVFHGGDDHPVQYDSTFRPYGIEADAPFRGPNMSTSLYVCALSERNRATLRRWAECCNRAIFGGRDGVFPGHGDQGVLNAVLFQERGIAGVRLLENALWSQHHCYWQGHVSLRNGRLFNDDAGAAQRSLHCGGAEKFWSRAHLQKLAEAPDLVPSYAWYLRHLWSGACEITPEDLADEHRHLVEACVRWRKLISAARGEKTA